MITARLNTQEAPEVWQEVDPSARVRADFPMSASRGSESSAAVVFELEPGCQVSNHTDSAEEVLVILQGTVEVTVNGERAQIGEGELAVMPAMAPHAVRNVGTKNARVLGVFTSGRVVSTFDHPWEPIGQQVFDF
jgi:quercetin dioxygenase-like cupin family protein